MVFYVLLDRLEIMGRDLNGSCTCGARHRDLQRIRISTSNEHPNSHVTVKNR